MKMISIFIICMFVISLPAYADMREPSNQNAEPRQIIKNRVRAENTDIANIATNIVAHRKIINELSDEEKAKFLKLSRERQKKILVEGAQAIQEYVNNLKVVRLRKEQVERHRKIAVEKIKEARQRFEEAKKDYITAKNYDRSNKQAFEDAREKIKYCKDKDAEECQKLEEQTVDHAKRYISNKAEIIIKHLEKIKEKVAATEGLTETEASAISDDIDNAILAVETTRLKINKSETKEDVQKATKELRQLWNRIEVRARLHTLRLLHAGEFQIIKRSELLEQKLERIIDKMQEEGKDISTVDPLVASFSQSIDEARELYKQGRSELIAARKSDESDSFKKAQDTIRASHEKLKEAQEIVKEILKQLREDGFDPSEIEDTDEVEIIEDLTETSQEEELTTSIEPEDYQGEIETVSTEETTTTTVA